MDEMSEETVEGQRPGVPPRGESPVEIQAESDRTRQAEETARTEKPTAEAIGKSGRVEKPTEEATGESDGVKRLTAEAARTERAAA